MIQPGQHVKCLLRNSTIVEGIVLKWEASVELQSLDQKSLLIIHHADQDIVFTKVMLSEEISQELSEEPQPEIVPSVVETICALPDNGDKEIDPIALQAKSTAELKVELAKQERRIIAGKLKDHYPGQIQKVEYGYPGLYKKPSAK